MSLHRTVSSRTTNEGLQGYQSRLARVGDSAGVSGSMDARLPFCHNTHQTHIPDFMWGEQRTASTVVNFTITLQARKKHSTNISRSTSKLQFGVIIQSLISPYATSLPKISPHPNARISRDASPPNLTLHSSLVGSFLDP